MGRRRCSNTKGTPRVSSTRMEEPAAGEESRPGVDRQRRVCLDTGQQRRLEREESAAHRVLGVVRFRSLFIAPDVYLNALFVAGVV